MSCFQLQTYFNNLRKMHPTIQAVQQSQQKKIPEIKTGYTIRVSQKVKEGSKERIQNFEGLVIKVGHGQGLEKTMTIRKIVEGIGVEKIFPMHSPNITQIKVIKKAKVRREKLYYMRERFGKSARLTERHVSDEERAAEQAKMEALYAEAVEAQKKEEEKAAAENESVNQNAEEGAAVETQEEKVEEKVVTEAEPVKEGASAEPEEKAEVQEVAKAEAGAKEEAEEEKAEEVSPKEEIKEEVQVSDEKTAEAEEKKD
jgi:large subunit ribosomal protein L19